MSNDDIILGIDLGTTNSAACIYKGGEFEIIPSAVGDDYFPSVVAVSENGELLVGHYARQQMASNAENSIAEVKLLMGTNEFIRFNGKDVRPQEISALILDRIKRDAESYLGTDIKRVVISVPASFEDAARNATMEAGQIAGFEVVNIVNEPTAACLAYATIKDITGNILVFDIGGGTLDITVGYFDGSELDVQSTVGYRVGGRNITLSLCEYVQNEFEKHNNLKLENYVTPNYDPLVYLFDAVETAVIELSSNKTAKIHIPSIVVTDEGERINLDMDVNRSKLKELSNFVIEYFERGIVVALSEAKLTKEDIGSLVFVGEYTKMPLIRESVEKTLGIHAVEGIDPSLCVAQGASTYRALVPVPVEININNTNYGNQTYQNEHIENEFKSAGYDKKLIEGLSTKFNGLTIEDKEAMIKIMDFFKNSELCFKDCNDLIRENVLEGNMSIDSFYKKREYIVKSRINENNRKLTRTVENKWNIKLDRSEKQNKKLINDIYRLNKSFDSLFEEYYGLKNTIQILKEKNEELTNQLKNISADKSNKGYTVDGLTIFQEDFKNANSLNMISGINYEDYKIDLEVLVSKGNIPEEQCNIFKSAFEEYYAGNFREAYENFNKLSGMSEWPQEYIDFLKATSLSSNGKVEEALKIIDRCQTSTELGEKYIKGKYPIRWFNYGNIFLDYANSQSNDYEGVRYYYFAIYCYQCARHNFRHEFKSKSNSNHEFKFKDVKSKEDFERNVRIMYERANICKSLLKIERLKDKIY